MLEITFQRSRCDEIRKHLAGGLPLEPGPDGWTVDDLLLLVAVATLKLQQDLGEFGDHTHLSRELQNAVRTGRGKDRNAAVDFLEELASASQHAPQGLVGDNVPPAVLKAFVRDVDGEAMCLPTSGLPPELIKHESGKPVNVDDDGWQKTWDMYDALYWFYKDAETANEEDDDDDDYEEDTRR